MAEAITTLIPVQELVSGRLADIREAIIDAVVQKASSELTLPEEQLLVRDIRAYDDLKFGANTDYLATAQTTNVWGTFKHTDTYVAEAATAGAYVDAVPDSTTMADQRYIVLYGVRDMRESLATVIEQDISLIKFTIGTSDKVIWDLSKCEAYKDGIAGVTPSAVVIPPLAPYQIDPYLMDGGVVPYLQLMGFVVEPVGLLLVPDRKEEVL
jgi:hypothetical protein